MFDRRLLENFDWILLFLVTTISVMGIVAIYSASMSYGIQTNYYQKQIVWFVTGLFVMILTTLIDYRVICRFAWLLHTTVIIFLILVLFYGKGGSGSLVQRWLKIGPLFFQPSEFAKFSLVLYLAHYFRDPRRIGDIGFRDLIWPLFVTLIPFILILRQPDLGTAGLMFFIFFPIIFLAGLQLKVFLVGLGAGVVTMPLAWFFLLRPYQQERILTFLNPDRDPLGKGYHVIQSKIAVGSGQLFGKGFLKGTQAQLNFLPARHTDFIFSVYSEEWGFLGSVILMGLYYLLIMWCLRFIGKTKDRSGSILTAGITSIIAAHIIINIAMVIGFFPIVGMPLPFFSYGGSSMLSMMIGIGLILNVRMRRFDIN